MKKSFLTLIVFFLVSSVGLIQAQNLKEVLDKHFKAVGQDKLAKVETYSIKAKVDQMGMEIPLEMKMKKPNKLRMDMDIMGQKMVQVFNGEKGWVISPMIGDEPQELSGAELDQAIAQADIEGELYNYEKKGHQVELVGKENIDGTDMYNLKVTSNKGIVRNYYINADTYLVSQVKGSAVSMRQQINATQKMLDYKDFDGIKIATKIVSETPMGDAEIVMEEVNFNVKIDDSIFEKPSN